MIILCTGLIRSASTWSFNVCRLLLEQAGQLSPGQAAVNVLSGYVDGENLDAALRQQQGAAGPVVIKSHFPGSYGMQLIERGEIFNICTLRDPRDCLVSLHAYGEMSFGESIQFIQENLRFINAYRSHEKNARTLFIDFDDAVNRSLDSVGRIAGFLQLDLPGAELLETDRQTNLNAAKKIMQDIGQRQGSDSVHQVRNHLADNKTLIHQGHVQDPHNTRWKNSLSAAEQKQVNEAFAPWLVSLGYETEESIKQIL